MEKYLLNGKCSLVSSRLGYASIAPTARHYKSALLFFLKRHIIDLIEAKSLVIV